MQNLANNNYDPNISFFHQLPDPSTNEPFNRATHPADKPIVSKHIFAIDSRQRDYDKYPNANNYNITIPDRYRNVTSIELKAATLPRTEYNVNSSNKFIDFSVGDYINKIDTTVNGPITNLGKKIEEGTYPLKISSPILTGSHISSVQAEIHVEINVNSYITNIIYKNQGSGYSHSKPPKVSLFDFEDFVVTVGTKYNAELREGQYVIGGNPQFSNVSVGTTTQSWVPTNLLSELESSMSYSILKDPDHCYLRTSWVENSHNDYPLLFCSRLMSQYPSLSTYDETVYNSSAPRKTPDQYQTNACNYNRIYTTNCLIFKTSILHNVGDFFTDDNSIKYNVLKVDIINLDSSNDYILYCSLLDKGTNWTGLKSSDYEICHWEMLFASGENNVINSASLLGYNKKNYYYNSTTNNNIINAPITVKHAVSMGGSDNTLIPRGLTYSSDNDYYLFGDPEYVVLSFRPKYGGNTISGINDRVDSQQNTNIDRVFACLIYDSVQPAVLQDVSSGRTVATIDSIANSNNSSSTFINNDNSYQDIKHLTGNSGSINVNYNKAPGMLKALKGYDFDKKVIDFPQPIAQLFNINIRFSKFSNLGKGDDKELYDFKGKEHLLLFEITCGDLMTGKRF